MTPRTAAFGHATETSRRNNNGVHLYREGYQFVARAIARGLQVGPEGNEINMSSAKADQLESLRQAIILKNHLYFYR